MREEIGTVSEVDFSVYNGLLKVKPNELCRTPADGPEIECKVSISFGVVPYGPPQSYQGLFDATLHCPRFQTLEELLMDPSKAAVAEDSDDVAGFGEASDMLHNVFDITEIPSLGTFSIDVGDEFFRVESVVDRELFGVGDGRNDDEIGLL